MIPNFSNLCYIDIVLCNGVSSSIAAADMQGNTWWARLALVVHAGTRTYGASNTCDSLLYVE